MLKKLRKKIILINMALCGAVLLCVFAGMSISAWQSAREELRGSLYRALDSRVSGAELPSIGGSGPSGTAGRASGPAAAVVVTTNAAGTVTDVTESGAALDDTVLDGAVSAALASGDDVGELSSLGLMYVRRTLPEGGVRLAFADTGAVSAVLRKSVTAAVLMFAGSAAVLLGISVLLSGLAVRPVAEAWRRQKEFVADASHELKTPLTVILANNNILLSHGEATVAAQRQWVESTGEEAARMKTLVDRMLLLARTDEETVRPEKRPLDLSVLTEEELLYFEPVAFERGVTLVSRVTPGVGVTGDPAMLRQLVQLLLDNAVKYAPAGTEVTAALEKREGRAVFWVRNFGDPIPPEELPRIFDRFYRTDKARTEGGAGLGLAIAKNLAAASGGTLAVKSTAETGTVFTVAL